MKIEKRNGQIETFRSAKITAAMAKAFDGLNVPINDDQLLKLTEKVEKLINTEVANGYVLKVERVQDLVEKILMQEGYYEVAKSYILYRSERAQKRTMRRQLTELVKFQGLDETLRSIQKDYKSDNYSLDLLLAKFNSFYKLDMPFQEAMRMLIKAAVELTTQEAPAWEFIAARLMMLQINEQIGEVCKQFKLRNLYDKISYLENEGLYGRYILQSYSKEEIATAESFIVEERNKLLNYSGLDLLCKRYVIHNYRHQIIETPQEMFLGIALHLAMHEKNGDERMGWVRKFYDMLSQLQVTMATPTLSNARKPYHQLSSCFIDTVPDSLEGIYRSITNFAQVSKFGGGMGLYFGKVRAIGSSIRGFQGVAGGVIRWVKLANDTAVAVDQLGMRQGSVACYLDIWHKDVPEFLQVRTNNGDDRMKAHDIFPAICYPDLFWRQVRDNINSSWYLLCPHEVLTVKGYALEDYYGEEWEKRYLDCVRDNRISKREIPLKELVRLILKSCVETGTPFTFNRDIVNRNNPNKHKGIIYCSNLCTEICQNMSEIKQVSLELKDENGDTVVVETTKPGDFVVCNLASLALGRIDMKRPEELESIVGTVVRALDNVIDLNFYPLPYAKHTNKAYRSLGLGISGYHHMLAKNGIAWESEEHLQFVDKIFERINYAAIKTSMELAKEKGKYKYFEGSDWETGEYFTLRNYTDEKWQSLAAAVAKNGLRNAYLIAIAPTSSTSIIAGTTAGLDPVMKRYFLEEKKGVIMPRVAPELSLNTYWLYKEAHLIDQEWTVRAAGVRQRHIDQAQSLNLYVTQNLTFRQILGYFIKAWENGVKTIYYCRSLALEVEDCESCSS
ncbi:ribonucleoside-diphosphate reductase subunit alpha [Mageeibacillus indolicus]|uniref:Ribonucleoside-diphosphate reductase n=1 Tax=Mageeibacillus indolicus TaxID=884684 RepID=A0A2J8B108_9FIRM|nr:ribonucleoside-diphosphate reductase subunit alpha [Mageeibacillus indolicus]PNH18444.1 ribonucleoside-diphosphate reductase subunit alpha [Mageeibacillus indolicus]